MNQCEGDCPHTMVSRCPGCRSEVYAMGVYAFSHGEGRCSCGYVVTPWLKATRGPDPSALSATAGPSPDSTGATKITSPTASSESV